MRAEHSSGFPLRPFAAGAAAAAAMMIAYDINAINDNEAPTPEVTRTVIAQSPASQPSESEVAHPTGCPAPSPTDIRIATRLLAQPQAKALTQTMGAVFSQESYYHHL